MKTDNEKQANAVFERLAPGMEILAHVMHRGACCEFHAAVIATWCYELMLQHLGYSTEFTKQLGHELQNKLHNEGESIVDSGSSEQPASAH